MMNQKYILHSVAVLAVAALATACSSEEILTDKTSGTKETVTITAYQPSTRVGFDKGGNGYWQEGDKIGVWSTGESKFSTFTIVSEDVGKASATFSGTVTGGIGQYAVYPYNENHNLSENTLTYYLPSEYTYTSVDQTFFPDGKDGQSFCMPMYGTIDNNTVLFKHLGGVICLKIDKMPAESGLVTVTEANNKLCGTFTANLSDETPEIKTTEGSIEEKTVTFYFSNATANGIGVFYLPVATGTYDLTIEVGEGIGMKRSLTTVTVDMTRAKAKVVNITADYSCTIDNHKFVDLGLPSGLLWAETNIGAATAADDGNYYAWGETTTKDTYGWSNYKHGTSSDNLTKYTTEDYGNNWGCLELSDDAANVNWMDYNWHCRMPRTYELEELMNTENCTWTWTACANSSGEFVNGYRVESVKNGNSIFLPASGYRTSSSLDYHGMFGCYWSSILYTGTVDGAYDNACCLHFESGGYDYRDDYRYKGFPIRPVYTSNSLG